MAKITAPATESTIATLLTAGRNVKEICDFTGFSRDKVVKVARELDLEPSTRAQKRAKALFESSDGLTYAEIASTLGTERLTNDGEKIHYLTVSAWASTHGWAWGGAADGEYAPARSASGTAQRKYRLRVSNELDGEINSAQAIAAAADSAWQELVDENTLVVAVAVVKGAAAHGVTAVDDVKRALMDRHGEAIRAARA